jgi:hypothetical protein
MYVPTATPPHLEGDAVKESAGHAKVGLGADPGVRAQGSEFRVQGSRFKVQG